MEMTVLMVLTELMAKLAPKENLEKAVPLDLKERSVEMVTVVPRVPQVAKVPKVPRESQDSKAIWVTPEKMVTKESGELKVNWDHLA